MKIYFTQQALDSLEETLKFVSQNNTPQKVEQIKNKLINSTTILTKSPKIGQEEEYLEHLNLNHRRLIVGYCKIIYRIDNENIYITDIFDTRQDPLKMKG